MNSSRYQKRGKRRKTNVVLNVLIGVIFVLIIVVGSQLIFGGSGSKQQASKVDSSQQTSNSATQDSKQPADSSGSNQDQNQQGTSSDQNTSDQNGSDDQNASSDQNADSENSQKDDEKSSDDQQAKDEDKNSSPAAQSDWKPVGTSQSEPHTATYQKDSQDWAEMKKAMSSATGISESNMTVWFIGNNGSPNDAKGTISDKTTKEKYKVSLHWVTNEGWQPVNVEKAN